MVVTENEGVDEAVLERARALAVRVRQSADEIESLRRLPPDLAAAMGDAGLFSMYVSKEHGGAEIHPLTALQVVEEIGRADGSAGWVTMLGSTVSTHSGWITQDVMRAMVEDAGPFRPAGSARVLGTAQAVDGGYLVNGRWDFQSGVTHANWVIGNCMVLDDGEPRHGSDGVPVTRSMCLPVRDGEVIDTWHTVGMRGTGSNDFAVEDLFVAQERSTRWDEPPAIEGPLYRPRFNITFGWVLTAANALGIARGAIDELTALASVAASTGSMSLLRDRPTVQARVGEAEAIVRASRAWLVTATGAAFEASKRIHEEDPADALLDVRLSIVHAIRESVRAVDIIFHAAGTNAVYESNRLGRFFRDIHVGVQHVSAAQDHYETAGRMVLGAGPGW